MSIKWRSVKGIGRKGVSDRDMAVLSIGSMELH